MADLASHIANVTAAFELYNNKEASWLTPGEALLAADEDGINVFRLPLNEIGAAMTTVRRFLSAYRFLKYNKPEFLENPNENASAEAVGYLPCLKQRMLDAGRTEEDFEEMVSKVLNGEIAGTRMMAFSKKLAAEKRLHDQDMVDGEEVNIDDKTYSMSALEKSIDVLDYVVEQALRTNSRKDINTTLGKRIYNLTVKLNGIIDEEYYQMYKEREVFNL